MKHLLIALILCISASTQAQDSLNVLFIGNSYTAYNNLPQLVAQVAASNGDYVTFNSNTPGGHTFQQHSTNTTTLSLIAQGNLDYVILQEQSQLPSFPIGQVQSDVYPYAKKLDSLINAANPCAETVFYNTWGRKNGDASNCANFPPLCTYQGMDSLLQLRYGFMADTNNALLSPVAQVWRYIRTNYPAIELYNPDESHPSVAGSYAAACAFYTVLFRKNPLQITFNAGLDSATAANIRLAAKLIAYDNLTDWHVGEYDPVASFTANIMGGWGQVLLEPHYSIADTYYWDLGDGNTSTEDTLYYNYSAGGAYFVTLIVAHCGMSDTLGQLVQPLFSSIGENSNGQLNIYPNPFTDNITINKELQQPINWQLVNALGQVVQVGNIYSITGLQNLPLGLYLLRLNIGGKAYSKPMLKQ
ncbi:MAG: T9SS type A sorting domain-containing protein [Sphingobacteriales bacterium JAD_PAG50586_3]|nr:MAG: T9SS type A sorting domain-containing protein [Sphingobacteriales bacterium JAD_PAG50586_3]